MLESLPIGCLLPKNCFLADRFKQHGYYQIWFNKSYQFHLLYIFHNKSANSKLQTKKSTISISVLPFPCVSAFHPFSKPAVFHPSSETKAKQASSQTTTAHQLQIGPAGLSKPGNGKGPAWKAGSMVRRQTLYPLLN